MGLSVVGDDSRDTKTARTQGQQGHKYSRDTQKEGTQGQKGHKDGKDTTTSGTQKLVLFII